MNKILSLIVPTYNMENLLPRCLNSLIVKEELQSFLEVLVINDGSKDNSSVVAHGFEKMYPNVFRVIDKENGNYGSCVNIGIEKASGKYLRLLDADDWFNTSGLEIYLDELLKIKDCDIVVTNYTIQYGDQHKEKVKAQKIRNGYIYDADSFSFSKAHNESMIWMHAMTINSDFARRVGWKNQTGISYTDAEYCYFPLSYAKTLCFFDIDLYQYFVGREGQTVSKASMKKGQVAFYKVGIRLLNDYNKRLFSPSKEKSLALIVANVLRNIYAYQLVYEKKPDYKDSFVEIVKGVNNNNTIHEIIKKFTYKKIPYVYIWEIFKIRVGRLIGE